MSLFRKLPVKPLLALLLLNMPLIASAQTGKDSTLRPPPAVPASQKKVDYKSKGSPLPEIRGVYPGQAVYTTKDLKSHGNLFVMMFNPTCEHCEQMTAALEKNIGRFNKSNIILLAAPGMGAYLDYFKDNTHVNQYPSIKVGLDSSDFIQKTFLYEALPQINVYSPKGKLLKSFSGITTIDPLIPYIQ